MVIIVPHSSISLLTKGKKRATRGFLKTWVASGLGFRAVLDSELLGSRLKDPCIFGLVLFTETLRPFGAYVTYFLFGCRVPLLCSVSRPCFAGR